MPVPAHVLRTVALRLPEAEIATANAAAAETSAAFDRRNAAGATPEDVAEAERADRAFDEARDALRRATSAEAERLGHLDVVPDLPTHWNYRDFPRTIADALDEWRRALLRAENAEAVAWLRDVVAGAERVLAADVRAGDVLLSLVPAEAGFWRVERVTPARQWVAAVNLETGARCPRLTFETLSSGVGTGHRYPVRQVRRLTLEVATEALRIALALRGEP